MKGQGLRSMIQGLFKFKVKLIVMVLLSLKVSCIKPIELIEFWSFKTPLHSILSVPISLYRNNIQNMFRWFCVSSYPWFQVVMPVPPRGYPDVCPCGVPCTPSAQSVRCVQNSRRLAQDFHENYLFKKGLSYKNETFMGTLASAYCKVTFIFICHERKFLELCHELMPVEYI